MTIWSAVVLNVVEKAIGDFEHGLVCNILVRPDSESRRLEKHGNGEDFLVAE